MKLWILLSFLFVSSLVFAQKERLKYDKNTEVKVFLSDSINYQYAISNNYITNRDYLTYIFWQMNVVGLNYPTVVWETLPGYENIGSMILKRMI